MNIRQRFHRLTLWNKINVFGAVASVIGIVLSVLFWKFPGSGTVPLAYSIAFDATLVELLDPYTSSEQQLLDGVEPFPAVPYYSDASNHPTAWPPRVARDRHAFAEKVSAFLNDENVKRDLDGWEESGTAPHVELISSTGRPNDLRQMERYARLRIYYSHVLRGDLARLSAEFGKTFGHQFAALEQRREELKGSMPNRLLVLHFENQNKFDVYNLGAEFVVAGDVYAATLNGKEIITSREGLIEPLRAEVETLKPWFSVEIRVWYAYVSLNERAFPGPYDISLEQTQGILIRNLAVSNGYVYRDKQLLTTFDAYRKFDVALMWLHAVR